MKQKRTAANYTWTPPRDFREICACQSHARRERTLWRRTLRAAKRRGVALLVTVPLAFGAIGIEAMNLSLPALAKDVISQRHLPVSTTHTITGAIVGVGAARRVSAVRWNVASNIVVAWIVTMPAAALVAALSYLLAGIGA